MKLAVRTPRANRFIQNARKMMVEYEKVLRSNDKLKLEIISLENRLRELENFDKELERCKKEKAKLALAYAEATGIVRRRRENDKM